MDKTRQKKAFEGLLIILDDELDNFNDSHSVMTLRARKAKISNLINYANQTGYIPQKGEDPMVKINENYRTTLKEFREIFAG